ncbi:MAG: hypothetical protein C4527_17400 [Candidatus Omnitrophota bacterium]|jgi:hypothetical protein|nr:MAG: hypothetical protein C4527_17400 [Candidatus Omnitrophota bacterium]
MNIMRKTCLLCAVLLLLAGIAFADRSTFDNTRTRVAMPFATPPTIDGFIDIAGGESWVYAAHAVPNGNSYWTFRFNANAEDFVMGGNVTSGPGPYGTGDCDADIWVGYDSQNLYVAVRVIDDFLCSDSAAANSANGNTWEDDSVEVFVDGDNSNYPTRDTAGSKPEGWSTGGQYVVTINNAYREAEAGNPGYGPNAAWYGRSEMDASGNMNFEFRISLAILGNPKPGDIIGFDIAINDDDDYGTLENQYTWAGQTHVEATYGNLILGPRSYTAPKVSAAPKIDGTISAGEYAGAQEINVTHYTGNYAMADEWELEVGDHDWSAWAVHDDAAIYVAVKVIDDIIVADTAPAGTEDQSTWEDDSVEIFFDSDASDTRGRVSSNLWEGQYVFTTNGAWRDNEANNPLFGASDDWFAASTVGGGGYTVEFKVVKDSLFEMKDTMGFEIAVNDDDTGARKTQLAWNGYPHNEATYGNITLSPGGVGVAEWALY